MTIEVPQRFSGYLLSKPETGIGYQVCSIMAKDSLYSNVTVFDASIIGAVDGNTEIPFDSGDIQTIIVTHGE